jgi:hypothetical protein
MQDLKEKELITEGLLIEILFKDFPTIQEDPSPERYFPSGCAGPKAAPRTLRKRNLQTANSRSDGICRGVGSVVTNAARCGNRCAK